MLGIFLWWNLAWRLWGGKICGVHFLFPSAFSVFLVLLFAACCFPSTGNLQPLNLDGDGIGFCLIPFMNPSLRWGRRYASGTLCLQGCWFSAWCITPASLTYRLLWGTDLCGAFVEPAEQHGCLWFGLGKGILCHSSGLFWLISSPPASVPGKMQWM